MTGLNRLQSNDFLESMREYFQVKKSEQKGNNRECCEAMA